MRCRVCGLELEAQDKLRNGAYRCPECGAINHTASSSRRSPSPWRKRQSALNREENPLKRRYFGFELWKLLAAALALIVVIVVIVLLVRGIGAKPREEQKTEMPTVTDIPLTEQTAEPGADGGEGVGQGILTVPEPVTTRNTGVALNDFMVSFGWAMDYLHYEGTLTLGNTQTATDGSSVQSYTFSDWFDLTLTLAPNSNIIRSAQATARLAAGSTDSVPAQAAFVSELYAFDNTINAVAARAEVEAMMADNTRVYGKPNFSARLTTGTGSYDLSLEGMLD